MSEQKQFDKAVRDFCVKAWGIIDLLPDNVSLSVIPMDLDIVSSFLTSFSQEEFKIYVHNTNEDDSEEEQEVDYMIADIKETEDRIRRFYVFCGNGLESYSVLEESLLKLVKGEEI